MQNFIKNKESFYNILNITTKLNFKCLCTENYTTTTKKRKCHKIAIYFENHKNERTSDTKQENDHQQLRLAMEVPRKRKYQKLSTTIR